MRTFSHFREDLSCGFAGGGLLDSFSARWASIERYVAFAELGGEVEDRGTLTADIHEARGVHGNKDRRLSACGRSPVSVCS
jgi:hypothetical protein